MKIEIACARCGKHCIGGNSRRKFCTPDCQRLAYWEKHKTRRMAEHLQWTRNNRERTTAHQIRYMHNEMRRHPWHSLIRTSKNRARQLEVPHDLDFEWGKARWTGRCELTGIEFATPDNRFGRAKRTFFPSIDRIVPELGYIKTNCRIILWAINVFKGDGTDEDMRRIAEALIKYPRPISHTGL